MANRVARATREWATAGASRAALGSAPRNRIQSLAVAAAVSGGAFLLLPDPERRAPWLYGAVLTLGYGHLLGGALLGGRPFAPALRRAAARAPWNALPPRVRAPMMLGLGLFGLAILYATYASALGHWPLLSGVFLAIATWHTVENDLALPGAYRQGLRMPAVSWDADTQIAAGGITALVLSLAAAALATGPALDPERVAPGTHGFAGIVPGMPLEEGLLVLRGLAALAGGFGLRRPGHGGRERLGLGLIVASAVDPLWLCARTGIAFVDVFALSTLYHLANWWVLSLEKSQKVSGQKLSRQKLSSQPGSGQKRSTERGFRLELLAVHALPMCFLGATWFGTQDIGAGLRSAYLSPVPYLFWSLSHVIQTAAGRWSPSGARADPASEAPTRIGRET